MSSSAYTDIKFQEWKKKKAKLQIIEKTVNFIGKEYQKLGGEIFSDYLFAQKRNDKENRTDEVIKLLDRLATNALPEDLNNQITLFGAYADFLLELKEVGEDLVTMIDELEPPTHKEAPTPNVNS